MSVIREPEQKIKASRPLKMCNKPTVALNYWWGSVRSGPYRDKNKLHFALQACVLLDAVYAVAPVPSIKVGMLGQQRGCRWSLLQHGGPETVKRPNLRWTQSSRVWILRDVGRVVTGVTVEVVGAGEKNLLKGWREDRARNLLRLSTFLISSLSHSAKQRREGRFIFMQFTVML